MRAKQQSYSKPFLAIGAERLTFADKCRRYDELKALAWIRKHLPQLEDLSDSADDKRRWVVTRELRRVLPACEEAAKGEGLTAAQRAAVVYSVKCLTRKRLLKAHVSEQRRLLWVAGIDVSQLVNDDEEGANDE